METVNTEGQIDAWNEARRIGKLVGNVSSLFSTAIRFLKKDAEAGLKTISPSTRFCLQRLMNSRSVKAPIYNAALCFRPEGLEGHAYISSDVLMAAFAPEEMATLLGLLYLYRRIQRTADEEEWKGLASQIHVPAELGGQIGRAIPNIGLGWGLLASSIRYLAWGLFLVANQKGYIQYRRHLKIHGVPFDIAQEEKTWGCNHMEVASILIGAVSLGTSVSSALLKGCPPSTIAEKDLDRDALRMRLAGVWLNALKDTGAQPQITHRGEFYPLRPELERLLQRTESIRKDGCKIPFFAKGKDDISPILTPTLYSPEDIIEYESRDEAADEIAAEEMAPPEEEAKPTNG